MLEINSLTPLTNLQPYQRLGCGTRYMTPSDSRIAELSRQSKRTYENYNAVSGCHHPLILSSLFQAIVILRKPSSKSDSVMVDTLNFSTVTLSIEEKRGRARHKSSS